MGRGLIIIVFGTMVVFTIVNLNIINSINTATSRSSDFYADVQARNIGNSMVNMLISELSDSNTLRINYFKKKELFGGIAKYKMIDTTLGSENLVKISVVGEYFNREKNVSVYVEVPDSSESSNRLPPFLDYAILGGEKVTLNGKFISVRSSQIETYNTNVHSNKEVTLNGDFMNIEGFVTYTNSVDIDGSNIKIKPISNPDGDPVHHVAPEVDIPNFNPSDYKSIANLVYNGDKSINGNIYLGSKDKPVIIYVGGKLQITGKLYGYGAIIVEGDVEVKGDLIANSPDPNYSKVGIFTKKKFIMNEPKTTVHCTVFAQEEIVIDGEKSVVYGNLISKSKVTLNDSFEEIRYKPISIEVAERFFDMDEDTEEAENSRLAMKYYYE
ncbi:hypothetical protein ACFLS9_05920 [Bacteroidota bacterium]